nr:clumping factor B-like [Pocillopora verrucosa]
MSYTPNHSYRGNYYYNPHWVQASGENPPLLVYGNMVDFTVGPDGTHYFNQVHNGPFTAPSSQTVKIVPESDPTASEDAVKRKPGKSSKSDDKKAGQKRDKEQGKDEKKSQDASGETDSSSDEDIWATEDEDCYEENDSDSSQDEYNRGPSRDYSRDRRRRPLHNRQARSPRSPRREVDARSTIVSLVPREFQLN